MKSNRIVFVLACALALFIVACQKEISVETGALPPPLPVSGSDTSQTGQPSTPAISITLKNPGFEDSTHNWTRTTTYKGPYGFKARGYAARTGKLGLSFYASQPQHYSGAKQETPWNGKISKTVNNLADGHYTFRIYASAVGNGMYLWADGGAGEVKVPIHSSQLELNTLSFDVKGGVAKFGFICINAGGAERFAPYFQADDAELLKN